MGDYGNTESGATSAHDAALARLAGRRAFKAGQPRLVPVADYTGPGDGLTLDRDAVRAWYAGWDAANLAADEIERLTRRLAECDAAFDRVFPWDGDWPLDLGELALLLAREGDRTAGRCSCRGSVTYRCAVHGLA